MACAQSLFSDKIMDALQATNQMEIIHRPSSAVTLTVHKKVPCALEIYLAGKVQVLCSNIP